MSIAIELNADDYNNIMGWFLKAFAAKNDSNDGDKKTYNKIAVMATQYLDDLDELEKDAD